MSIKVYHPDYDTSTLEKFRITFQGGKSFVYKYLVRFSIRETYPDFSARQAITHCPALAKGMILEIKNAITERLGDVVRSGGGANYQAAVAGESRGVDNAGRSMNTFLSSYIVPELLAMGKVGVFVDKDRIPLTATKAQTNHVTPYLYTYPAEDILNWTYKNNILTCLLLCDHIDVLDDNGLVKEIVEQFRLIKLTDGGVQITLFDKNEKIVENILLNLDRIPFVLFDIAQSLLVDAADYQISLLNLGSSDINYALKSNYPFYTEQYNQAEELASKSLEEDDADKDREIKAGSVHGRRYSKGLERPGFINPSPEPLRVSMEKQKQLAMEMRQLINLALASVEPVHASAESKKQDEKGLKSGLAAIGEELQAGEKEIGELWRKYENSSAVNIIYPKTWDIKNDADRREEAESLKDLIPTVPSKTFQKALARKIARTLLSTEISPEELFKINKEIDSATVIVTDPEIIQSDHKEGFVSTKTASTIRGYAPNEADLAKQDHAERVAELIKAQAGAASRGAKDLDIEPDKSAKAEKEVSQDVNI